MKLKLGLIAGAFFLFVSLGSQGCNDNTTNVTTPSMDCPADTVFIHYVCWKKWVKDEDRQWKVEVECDTLITTGNDLNPWNI